MGLLKSKLVNGDNVMAPAMVRTPREVSTSVTMVQSSKPSTYFVFPMSFRPPEVGRRDPRFSHAFDRELIGGSLARSQAAPPRASRASTGTTRHALPLAR